MNRSDNSPKNSILPFIRHQVLALLDLTGGFAMLNVSVIDVFSCTHIQQEICDQLFL